MKLILIFIFFFSGAVFAQADSSLCAQFKTGVFAYRNDSSNAVLIKRSATRQEELIKKSGIVTKFKIRWVTACSYEIKQVWSNSKTRRKANGSTTTVVITNAGKDQYEYSCACNPADDGRKSGGTVYRVPE